MIRFDLYCCLLLLLLASSCQPTTAEGFHYEVHKAMGLPPAEIGDEVFVYFEIRTKDTLLFASPDRNGMPTVLTDPQLNRVKKATPIADVLPRLGEGDSATVYMPVADYMRTTPGLENASELQYNVVVRKINRAGSEAFGKTKPTVNPVATTTDTHLPDLKLGLKENEKGAAALAALNKFIRHVAVENSQLRKTGNGIIYHILEAGQGEKLKAGDQIQVHYLGSLADGTIFAETYTNDLPFAFVYQDGRVIKGWDQTLGLVQRGGKLLMAVPSELAYGTLGKEPYIAPNETLYYYLELIE